MMEARGLGEPSKRMSKVDQAIIVIKYQLKKKQARVEEMARRVDINENQRIFIGEETELIKNCNTLIDYCKREFSAILGKMPPQDEDLERSILGTCIFETPHYDVAKNFLRPEHFYNDPHQEIWRSALNVGSPIDYRKIIEDLRNRGLLELAGGPSYVVGLTAIAGGGHVDVLARVLIEKAIKRELIRMAGAVLHDAYSDETDCFDLLETAEEQFKAIRAWIK